MTDLRLLLPAVAAWVGALAGGSLPVWTWGAPSVVLLAVAVRGRSVLMAAALLAAVGTASAAGLRSAAVEHSVLASAAGQHSFASVTLRVSTDPVSRRGRFGEYVVVRGTTSQLQVRGTRHETTAPILVLGSGDWSGLGVGAIVRASGRLAPPDSPDLAAVMTSLGSPYLVRPPSRLDATATHVRGAIREAARPASPVARELVPGLVTGDDAGLSDDVVDDFRTAGLTHLTAVSGTNLTLVVGFLLVLARWGGVRARGLLVVGLLGVLGFVLLARPEPSVLRAAVMGSVALLGLGVAGRGRGARCLSVAVLVLMLVDPWLARSVGFALSVLATAGILFLAPPIRDALSDWLPRWLAEGVAVPVAAQLACTPLVAAISGQVSLVAVLANLLVAPVVAPATVLGLLGGLVLLLDPTSGHALGWTAGLCADWITCVGHRAAMLPTAAVGWSARPASLAVLTVVCVVLAVVLPAVASSRPRSLLGVVVVALVMIRPVPTWGWPPTGWVMVACDVGQGDGLVLNAGPGTAVVVDAGPDPELIDRCLRRLGVHRVAVLVLTHFHADHVDGLPGVLRSRAVGEVDVTGLRDPPSGAEQVGEQTKGIPVRVPAYGEVRRAGQVLWQVVGPAGRPQPGRTEGSAPNNASLVLLVQLRGLRILLCGDVEPEAQRQLAASLPGLRVDVLKVPHHGSRYQDEDLLGGLGARLAVVSVGKDNDYGHPSGHTLDMLRRAGMRVERTDLDGDVAVIEKDGELRVATSR